jgi:AraC-like DNA-binding protein
MYREFLPPPQMRSSIACLWVRRGDGRGARILPDACSDIVWREGKGGFLAGPDTSAWLSSTIPGELIVGASLLPGAGGAAFGLPLSELRGQRVDIGEFALDLREELSGELRPSDAPSLVLAAAARLTATSPPDRAVQAAVVRLLAPGQRVEDLADDLGFSERQLRRRFLVAVGYGPKTLQRVLRFRRFLAAASGDLAAAALEAGYSDQPHLTRECRRLTGLSPAQLIAWAQGAPAGNGSRAVVLDRR